MRDSAERGPNPGPVGAGDLFVGLLLAGTFWCAAVVLDMVGAGRGSSALDPGYIVICALVILAPTCAMLPAGIRAGAPLWALEAIAAWSVLGYLLFFVDPAALGRGLALALVVPAVLVASASPALLWRAMRGVRGGPRRFAYVAALVPAGITLLAGTGALAGPNVVLVGAIAATARIVLWNATRPARPRRRPVSPPTLAPVLASGSGRAVQRARPVAPPARGAQRAVPATRLRPATRGT